MDPPTAHLHLLPVEVWLACLTLCSIRQLRRLSLVCHLFRSLCMPLLLEHQSFDVARLEWGLDRDNWRDRVRRLHRTAVRMDRLAEGPYALLVRSLNVSLSSDTPPMTHYNPYILNIHLFDAMCKRIIMTFCATLGVYKNLTSLNISGLTIDAAFLGTLASLPQLDALGVSTSYVVAWEGFLRLGSLTASWLRRLPESSEGPLRIASPDTIHTLHLDSESSPLIAGFGTSQLTHLVHLSLNGLGRSDSLIGFLAQCPRLESLSTGSSFGLQPSLPAIHFKTIPLLRTLTGPPKMVQALVPNRPVSCVTVLAGSWQEEGSLIPLCIDISRSSSPVYSLSLPRTPPTLEFLDTVMSLFPDLRELTITLAPMIGIRTRCGGGFRRGRAVTTEKPSIDSRTLELRGEDAFDNPPAEELSDNEADESPQPILVKAATEIPGLPGIHGLPAFSSIAHVLRWLSDRRLSLPPTIEVFRLQVDRELPKFSLAEEHRAIAVLSGLYPLLREVQFGLPSTNWKRTGPLWKSEENKSIRIVS
ncbi:hypothetical protein FB451DRAFT_1387356 [Mycena latifolia]|nr:hypothetical protein FB451DRAFT_1387356 [Mycena latifolia]